MVSITNQGPLPSGYDEFGESDPPPWVTGPGGIAVLFYAGAQNADTTIGTHGSMGAGKNSKILWITEHEVTDGITLTATNEATGEVVIEELEGSTNFPTTPELPSVGCWSISAFAGSQEVATVYVEAVDFE